MNACDYIRDYRARARIYYVSNMAHPYRHENMLIRALWWKQEAWMAAEGMDDAERPSYEYDVAIDAYYDAREKWRMAVREAWLNRALERGNDAVRGREVV